MTMTVSKVGEVRFVVRGGRNFLRIYRPNLDKCMWYSAKGKALKEVFERLDSVSSQVLEDEYQEMLGAVR